VLATPLRPEKDDSVRRRGLGAPEENARKAIHFFTRSQPHGKHLRQLEK
jgi:hypothetical protein